MAIANSWVCTHLACSVDASGPSRDRSPAKAEHAGSVRTQGQRFPGSNDFAIALEIGWSK